MPADLQVPGTRKEAGIDHVDVMGFLGLKRAVGLKKDVPEKEEEDSSSNEVKP